MCLLHHLGEPSGSRESGAASKQDGLPYVFPSLAIVLTTFAATTAGNGIEFSALRRDFN
jgi:hypothetical protein